MFRLAVSLATPFLAALLVAACAPAPVAEVTPAPAEIAGTAIGAPVSCVITHLVSNQRIVDKRTILFQVNQRWYRNDLPNECPGLDRINGTLITRTTIGQTCAGDIFEVADLPSGFHYGSCVFGKYTPVDLPRNRR